MPYRVPYKTTEEDRLYAGLMGLAQGFSQQQQAKRDWEMEQKKEMWKEQMKGKMERENMLANLEAYKKASGETGLEPSFKGGKFGFESVSPYEQRKRELDLAESERKAQEATPEGQQRKAEMEKKGLPIETGGKLAMVKQAKQDIQDVRGLLFPQGTPESFSRGRAFLSNIPGSRGHVWSGLIPQAMPFSEMGQKIYSRLQNAVAAKLRVETGAQANPSEVENILQRFGVTSASNPKAAWDALQRLENFMDETISITDPRGLFTSPTQQREIGFNPETQKRQELYKDGKPTGQYRFVPK